MKSRVTADETQLYGYTADSSRAERQWEEKMRAIPDPKNLRAYMERLSARPHNVGSAYDKDNAEWILGKFKEFGLDAHIETFSVLFPTPKERLVELVEGGPHFTAKLQEPAVPEDPTSNQTAEQLPTYNAYSIDGDVTGPLVYVNYGVPEDYEVLERRGISVKGAIIIARYGRSWRGIKPFVGWEHGAIGCIIYSDPRDDGYSGGAVFPKGPWRPKEGVQRGSVQDSAVFMGDPLTPGIGATADAKRLPIKDAQSLTKIPVLPISYADAQPLLEAISGPVAPRDWRGGLPITYHIGSATTGTRVHLKVEMDNSTHPLYDVIARIPGREFPDEWVMDGNHHDAWVYGASDPLSGAAPLMETARTLAELTKKGWKPKRTILLAFWDGEEFGLIGSTEWMEKHADELNRKLVAYLNSDSSGKGKLSVGGSHTLEAFIQEVARDVNDPESGRPLLHSLESNGGEFRINALGSGSDYTPFLQHLGVATLDIRFTGNDEGVYHSDYDDYYWYTHFSDTGFVYGQTLSKVHSTALMRLADAPILPFEFGRFAWTVSRYLDELEHLPNQPHRNYLPALRRQISLMHRTSADLNSAYLRVISSTGAINREKLAALNELLFHTERSFTLDPGLPGRPWFRHRIYAPGQYTGYDAKTLPGIREALEADKPDQALEQAGEVTEILQKLNDQIVQAKNLLEGM
ncbi:MAG TPA: M28 family metallopeptidase [Bryobacteraceae bacterium]|nr:M28 family metallopeptidase [Bryobacteraceae bacterium]